ncbi:MAG: hypothetical protein LBL00_03875 [Endomicrobium sp.]|nr:hypothetical protein [Endomicrobium sp.]
MKNLEKNGVFLYNSEMNYLRTLINKYKFEIFSFFFIFLLIFLTYRHCSNFNFIYYDDDTLILNRVSEIENDLSLKDIFLNPVFNGAGDKFYRPALILTFSIDTLICGGEPGFYHYSNVLLHTLAAFLVLIFFRTIGYSKKISAAAGIILAVHPVLTSAVSWIAGRNDILLTIFALLSLIFFVKSSKSNITLHCVLSAFFLLAALFTKETAIIIPVIYILYILLYEVKVDRKFVLRFGICIFLTLLLYVCFRYFALSHGVKNITLIEMFVSILRSLKSMVWYSGIILLAEKILIFPETANIVFIKSLLSTSFFIALCVFLRKYYNPKHVLFGIFWFIFFIIPPYIMPLHIYFTHRLYLPIIGCFIVIFEILKAASVKYPKSKNILLIVFCISAVIMSFLSYKYSFYYQDRKSFCFKAYEENPVSPQINIMMSSYYRDNGNTDKAQEHAFKALEYAQKQYIPRALTEISLVYYKKGELDKAEEYFKKTIEANKLREQGYLGLSAVYEQQGDKQSAIDILTEALNIIPHSKSIKKRLDNLKNNRKEMSYTLKFKI